MVEFLAKKRAEHVRIIIRPFRYAFSGRPYPTRPVWQIAEVGGIAGKHGHLRVGPEIGERIVGPIVALCNDSKTRLGGACGDNGEKIKMPVGDVKQEHPVCGQAGQVAR